MTQNLVRTLGLSLMLCLILGSAATLADTSLSDSDSGIFGPTYAAILKKTEQWQMSYPSMTEVIDYGRSVEGRTLRLVLVSKKGTFSGPRPTMLMSGGTHGDEYLNIEDRLPEELLKRGAKTSSIQEYLDRGGVLIFVPVLNPDGYDHRYRENANGIDLNRDWDVTPAGYKGFKEIETRSLAQQLEKLRRERNLNYSVTVDYHCCIGAVLYPWSYTKKPISFDDGEKHRTLAGMAKKSLGIDYGTTWQILGYAPLGTTKDFYYAEYRATTFTYEGRQNIEKNYLAEHTAWWEGMIASVNLTR